MQRGDYDEDDDDGDDARETSGGAMEDEVRLDGDRFCDYVHLEFCSSVSLSYDSVWLFFRLQPVLRRF